MVPQTMEEFISDLRRLVDRWTASAAQFEAMGEVALARQIQSWIVEAEGIIAAREDRNV